MKRIPVSSLLAPLDTQDDHDGQDNIMATGEELGMEDDSESSARKAPRFSISTPAYLEPDVHPGQLPRQLSRRIRDDSSLRVASRRVSTQLVADMVQDNSGRADRMGMPAMPLTSPRRVQPEGWKQYPFYQIESILPLESTPGPLVPPSRSKEAMVRPPPGSSQAGRRVPFYDYQIPCDIQLPPLQQPSPLSADSEAVSLPSFEDLDNLLSRDYSMRQNFWSAPAEDNHSPRHQGQRSSTSRPRRARRSAKNRRSQAAAPERDVSGVVETIVQKSDSVCGVWGSQADSDDLV